MKLWNKKNLKCLKVFGEDYDRQSVKISRDKSKVLKATFRQFNIWNGNSFFGVLSNRSEHYSLLKSHENNEIITLEDDIRERKPSRYYGFRAKKLICVYHLEKSAGFDFKALSKAPTAL
mmetsp:Transcript_30921/g.28109  ORF Transcript_30921/g.28109 Transcript_30921/m.28109 type:complete len:119 (+) Transcript_30921:1158-1514(+)